MDPISNQIAYADSDHIKRNFRPLLKKLSILFFCISVVGTLITFFVWPVPHLRVAENLRIIDDQYNSNNYDEALSMLEEFLKEDSDNADYLIKKSLILAEKGKQTFKEKEFGPKAVSVAAAALALYPQHSEAHRALGYAYEIQEKYQEAHTYYDAALSLDQDNAYALYGKGHVFELQGDMINAEENYRSALLKDPMFDRAYVGVARALIYKGENEEAIELLTKAFWLTHSIRVKAESLTLVAKAAIANDDVDKALGAAEQATTIDPSYPLGWYMYGTVIFEDSQNEKKYNDGTIRDALVIKSIQHLQQAIRLNVNQSIAYHQLGIELNALKRPYEAVEAFRKGLTLVPKDITLSATEKLMVQRQLEEALLQVVQSNGTLQGPRTL